MTKVEFVRGDYGFEELNINNHAEDKVVCSAISSLGMTLIGALQHSFADLISECYYSDGFLSVKINPSLDEDRQKTVDTIFETIYVGLKQIEATYPQNININDNFLVPRNGKLFV